MTSVDERRRLGVASLLDESDDAAWDAFVATIPGGLYPQSSRWAKVKAHIGWRASRVALTDGGHIVAGAQMLLRPLSRVGTIGYVPKGPLVPAGDVELARVVLDALLAQAARCRVLYLVLQPPTSDEALERELAARGFAPTADIGTPSTTLRVDLRRSAEELLVNMNESTRRNIRRGQSHGVKVRMGLDGDIGAFSRLAIAAAQRKRFAMPPPDYYPEMWRVLREGRHIELFVAELDGEPVSAMLVIVFGDTAFAHASAWTGSNSPSKPNHVLQWAAITWARENGYHYFDVEGVDITIARALTDRVSKASVDVPDSHATRFKIGFGGQLTGSSVAYEYVPNHLLRWAYRRVYLRFKSSRAVNVVRKKLMQRIQSRRTPQASEQD
ncbi:MAG: peptidoglycan bridge formation glycyltransferase FemA/FemB family protein [Chloroflexi bacterium]|nr:peptidoglycan bridge formation glycyltransferase FemA/FemB family protein [Chloroflexota bacterium]